MAQDHQDPSNGCQKISLKTTNVKLMVVLEARGVTRVSGIHSLGDINVQTFVQIHPVHVDISSLYMDSKLTIITILQITC